MRTRNNVVRLPANPVRLVAAAQIPLTEALPYNEFALPAQHVLMREPYGVVAVFKDPWGGKWDLI